MSELFCYFVLFLAQVGIIILVDTHLHDDYGAVILWGTDTHLEDFVRQCQIVTNLQGDTFGNLSFLTF